MDLVVPHNHRTRTSVNKVYSKNTVQNHGNLHREVLSILLLLFH